MQTLELRKRLIDKINHTNNEGILQEASNLLQIELEDIEVYKLNDGQKSAIAEARQQIKEGNVLTNEQASKEIDEWLSK